MSGTDRCQGPEKKGWGWSIYFSVSPGLWFGGGGVHLPHGTASVGGLALDSSTFLPAPASASSPRLQLSTVACAWASLSLVGCRSPAHAFAVPS